MDWGTVKSAATTVDRVCIEGRHSGGVWIVKGICPQIPSRVKFPLEKLTIQYTDDTISRSQKIFSGLPRSACTYTNRDQLSKMS